MCEFESIWVNVTDEAPVPQLPATALCARPRTRFGPSRTERTFRDDPVGQFKNSF